ncbi:hypothetical protein ACFWOJ_38785 [Streptomyces sp. NPDC058439]|uniref:hypothetical protein n=1 Tax=Streptomyces sp. NPDC058439 TaxID=3346500 RepID=UPI0036634488
MSRTLMLALAIVLLIAECVAQFIAHDQVWTAVLAGGAIAVVVIRWALGPQTPAEMACPADCTKCAEDGETK